MAKCLTWATHSESQEKSGQANCNDDPVLVTSGNGTRHWSNKEKLYPVVDYIKLFGGNLDFPKTKKLNKVCYYGEPILGKM